MMADVDVELALLAFQSQEYARASTMFSDLEFACQLQLNEALAASVAMSNEAEPVRPEQLPTHARGPTDGGGRERGAGDRAIACAVQSRELRRQQQELVDRQKAVQVGEDVAVEMQRSWHDREFSRLVSEMPEDEWEEVGDQFEKPFFPSASTLNVGQKAVKPGQDVAVEMQRRWHDRELKRLVSEISEEESEDVREQFEKPVVPRASSSSSVAREDASKEGNSAKQACILYFAKAREDPGNVGIAWAVTDASTGHVLFQHSKFLGLDVSSYLAEYTALIDGLAYAYSAGVRNIAAHSDSALVANQFAGQWRARSSAQVKLLEQVTVHQDKLDDLTVLHVPKAKNQYVISLASRAIQAHVEKLRKHDQQIPVQPMDEEPSEDCPICFEKTHVIEMFSVRSCSHKFCRNCLSKHVDVQVKENLVPVRCPLECSNHLELDQCSPYLPPGVADAFSRRLAEASIPEADRFYCPFKNCSALMSKGGLSESSIGSSSRHPHASSFGRCECMQCHRLFCVECQVPWHVDLSCAEFQKLPADERDPQDVKLHQLARNQNWQRCKKCKHVIELNTGCYHMTCKCGHEFCYTCGAEWKNKQATCKCKLWDENNIIEDEDDLDSEEDGSESEYEFDPDDFPVGNIFYKTQICRHWLNGHCWSGDTCNFAHGQGELRRTGFRHGYRF